MKLFMIALFVITSFAYADVYEANSNETDKLDVTWTYEPIVFEKELKTKFYVTPKENAQQEGQNKNQLSCFKKKGKLVGKTILHKYELGTANYHDRSLKTRVISVCKFPELK